MNVTPEGFAGLIRSVLNIADACCGGKVVITLEGGYNLTGLRDSVKMVLREMAGLSEINTENIVSSGDQMMLDSLMGEVFQNHGRYWKNLKA
jgi:acetoin utilization deacetylase AcuC-like enzyme